MKKKLLVLFIICLSGCEAIFVEDISKESVTLLAPKENTEVLAGDIQFNWEAIIDATEYEVQIASPSFENASQIVLDSIVSSTIISKILTVGDYEWRVKAMNSGYQTEYSKALFTVK